MSHDLLSSAYQQHADELLGFLQSQVNCPQQAADLRQEVYVRLQQAAQPERIGDVRAYLYRIARNLLTDLRRRRRVEGARLDPESVHDELISPAPSVEAAASSAEELDRLRAALARLPAVKRWALLWYRLDGLTLRDIGARLGVSESMAGRYVNQALAYCEAQVGRSVI